MKSIRFRKEILLSIKIFVPVFGILFFDWSIGTVFFYFCLELLFIGGETLLRIFFSGASTVGQKIWSSLRFMLIYSLMLIFIIVLMGHFFDGGAKGNMEAHAEKEVIWFLMGVYLFDFVFGFLWSQRYKAVTGKQVENETYKLLGVLFIMLAAFLFVASLFTGASETNYALGIAIIAGRNLGEYLLTRKLI
jgi:hypothetical protein